MSTRIAVAKTAVSDLRKLHTLQHLSFLLSSLLSALMRGGGFGATFRSLHELALLFRVAEELIGCCGVMGVPHARPPPPPNEFILALPVFDQYRNGASEGGCAPLHWTAHHLLRLYYGALLSDIPSLKDWMDGQTVRWCCFGCLSQWARLSDSIVGITAACGARRDAVPPREAVSGGERELRGSIILLPYSYHYWGSLWIPCTWNLKQKQGVFRLYRIPSWYIFIQMVALKKSHRSQFRQAELDGRRQAKLEVVVVKLSINEDWTYVFLPVLTKLFWPLLTLIETF